MSKKFVGLIILDGFGIRKEEKGNAIKLANPENFNYYYKNFPSTLLDASGEAVGLPSGVIGNSETGHMNIGAGRLVNQNLQKINYSLKDGSFFENKELLNTIEHARKNNSNLHLMGLLSDGGVHSHINHLFGLIDMSKDKVRNVYIHAFLDGRDTQPDSSVRYIKELLNKIKPMQNVKLASLMGRYYSMDREQNWDRTEKAYNALVLGAGNVSEDPIEAVKESYAKDITDEFVRPVVLSDVRIFDNDGVIFFNYRDDRARQLSSAFVDKKFKHFNRKYLDNVYFCGFSKYDNFKNFHTAFEEDVFKVNLSQVVSKNRLKQFKITETTKYAHVTFYLNGGIEKPYRGEKRFLIKTIKDKPFDEAPQMRTREITAKAIHEIQTEKYSLMVLNYSNCDMLGHTGNLDATVESVKIMDEELKKLVDVIISIGGVAVITADHGNAEKMFDENGNVLTGHTLSQVPFIVVNAGDIKLSTGCLSDIAPTILDLLNIEKPEEFTAKSLIIK